MGVLKSKLFVATDPATADKLESCATGKPNEWSSHFAVNANTKGEHVRLVQKALKQVQAQEPGLGIPEFKIDGNYSPQFAKAVKVYKDKRGIKNYAGKIDDIVGIKTLRSLDKDVDSGELPVPPPPPEPLFQRERRTTKRVFERFERSGGGPAPNGSEDGKDILKGIQEFFNSFNDPEAALGEENKHHRRDEMFDWTFRVNLIEVKQDITITQTATFGDPMTETDIRTEYVYKYGPPNGTVVMNTKRHVNSSGFIIDRHEVETKSRDEANKKILWTPPKP